MKKFLFFLSVLIFKDAYPATGNASDGVLLPLVVLAVLMLILGIDFGIKRMKCLVLNYWSKIRNNYLNAKEESHESDHEFLQGDIHLTHEF